MELTGMADRKMGEAFLKKVKEEAALVTTELLSQAKLDQGDILIVGCSSSEVAGEKIGTFSSVETAQAVFEGIYEVALENGIFLAAQCCEHLNRAVITEKEAVIRERLTRVNVIPKPKAGGSFAATAYERLKEPAAVEHIRAQAGIDIGDTLIGMHLQEVAVPVRTTLKQIGNAHVVCARTRAKFTGGARAVYDEDLL